MPGPEMVRLHVGSEVPRATLDSIMVSLNTLWDQNAASVIELVGAASAGSIEDLSLPTMEHAKRLYLVTADGGDFARYVSDVLLSAWDPARQQLSNPARCS